MRADAMVAQTYYVSGDGGDGQQLWVVTTDGQDVTSSQLAILYEAPAVLPDPASPGQYELGTRPEDSQPSQFTNFGGGTLFVASGLHTGRELFVTDGTVAGTHLVKDFTPGYTATPTRSHRIAYTVYSNAQSSDPTGITAVGNGLAVFTANDGTTPSGLFATDGTAVGTVAVTSDGLYSARYLTAFGGSALFAGTGSASAGTPQLWITDGTAAGTHAIAGPSEPGQADPTLLGAAGSGFAVTTSASGGVEAFFAATTALAGTELWVTDGTAAGTRQVADINTTLAAGIAQSSGPSHITALGSGRAIFAADDGVHGRQLWTTDGTFAGTTLVTSIDPGGNPFTSDFTGFFLATIGGQSKAFFEASTGSQTDPWVTDGTTAGTQQLLAESNAYAGNFTAFAGKMVFTAYDAAHGRELWISDGTAAGTTLLDDINPGAVGSSPSDLHVVGTTLLFTADAGGGSSLWQTDGTTAGTHAVTGVNPIEIASVGVQAAPCFARGTRLLGTDGPVAVEDLREGDMLLTLDGAARPVIWIGDRKVDCRRHPDAAKVWPVRVQAHAFGPGLPAVAIVLSPDHAVLIDDVLIPIGRLVNGLSVVQEEVDSIHYFHVELPLHDVLLAEGLPVESFLETGNRHMFAGQPGMRLHPDFARPQATGLHWENACAPLVLSGPAVERTAAKLRARMPKLAA